ncbi:MAG: hypothetical protein AB8F34_02575 [Akkermansiaceae bacterium]
MKTTFQLLALAAISLAFSSCCGLLPCSGSLTAEKEVTTYTETQRTVYGGKGSKGSSYVVTDRVPVTTTETVGHCCNKCGSSFCPKPQCCGIVSKAVLVRATAQGGTGEPHLGLIPTMKDLPLWANQ